MKTPYTSKQDIAWQFLRKNLDYQHASGQARAGNMQLIGNTGVPCTTQTASDIAAQNWGLFAFCDPCASNSGQKPFWSIALTLDADIIFGGQTPLLSMMRRAGAGVAGLLLLDGDLILRIDHVMKAVQLRIKNGLSFNEHACLVLRLPVDLSLSVKLNRGLDLWSIVSGEQFKKTANRIRRIMVNCFAFSTGCLPERASAR